MSVTTFSMQSGTTGRIRRTRRAPFTYTAYTGYYECGEGRDATYLYRAFLQFDTSSIPDTAIISKVEFKVCYRVIQPAGEPAEWGMEFYIGDIIGSTLDGNSTEWNAGELMVEKNELPVDKTWIDLAGDGLDPTPYVNKSGMTDIKIVDTSTANGATAWGRDFNDTKADEKCQLRVTYTTPAGAHKMGLLGVGP